jgi:hypothetical protein
LCGRAMRVGDPPGPRRPGARRFAQRRLAAARFARGGPSPRVFHNTLAARRWAAPVRVSTLSRIARRSRRSVCEHANVLRNTHAPRKRTRGGAQRLRRQPRALRAGGGAEGAAPRAEGRRGGRRMPGNVRATRPQCLATLRRCGCTDGRARKAQARCTAASSAAYERTRAARSSPTSGLSMSQPSCTQRSEWRIASARCCAAIATSAAGTA